MGRIGRSWGVGTNGGGVGGIGGVITGQTGAVTGGLCTGSTTGAGTGGMTGSGVVGVPGAGVGGMTGSTMGNGSPGRSTLVPQWLQNAEPGGTRLPHREQNAPSGRVVVSIGLGGTGPVSTIFFIGRAISIFFFTAELLVIRICGGVVTSGSAFCSGSGAGATI